MNSSRRNFLATGLALPAAASASRSSGPADAKPPAKPAAAAPGFTYRTIGSTGLKVTSVGFGCMVTSDGSVIERAADVGITYFDTARGYSNGNNERMVGAALKNKRKNLVLSSSRTPPPKTRLSRTSTTASANSAPTTSTSGTCTPRANPTR